MKKKLLLIGIGGHSRSCIDVIESTKEYEIVGYVEKNSKAVIQKTNLKLLGYDKDLPKIFNKIKYAHISVGQMKDLNLRKQLYYKLTKIGFNLPAIISKKSYVSNNNVRIGNGTIVMHNVIVNSHSTIKDNCIINTGSIIEHDCYIDSHTHIGPGSILNGGAKLGKQIFIGSGSVAKHKTKIKDKSFYPMMSKILWKFQKI